MPRYFFNVMNGVKTQDFDGMALLNLEAARAEAKNDIADIMQSHFKTLGNNWSEWSIEICNGDGVVLLVVPFSAN